METSFACDIVRRHQESIPELKAVDRLLAALLESGFTELKPALIALSETDAVGKLVRQELVSKDTYVSKYLAGSDVELYLFEGSDFTITLRGLGLVNPRGSNMLAGTAVDLFLANPSSVPITIPCFDETCSDRHGITAAAPVQLQPGEIRYFAHTSGKIIHFESVEGGAVLTMRSGPRSRDVWVYDLRTLRRAYKAAVDPNDSRLVIACRILAASKLSGVSDNLRVLAETHPAHFVRWEALRCLSQIDEQLAFDCLQRAVCDPHEHVSRAASLTLSRFRKEMGHGTTITD